MRKSPADPTRRFSGRSTSYAEGRPSYPRGVLTFLRRNVGLRRDDVIADVGSGTGKLSELLLTNGNIVYCVEPNADMRREAERRLAGRRGFRSVEGTAEDTGLAGGSVDLVTVGHAFHWFDHKAARKEFARILKPPGYVLLVWNTRKESKGTFGYDYEALVEKHTSRRHGWSSSPGQRKKIAEFFGMRRHVSASLENSQELDFRQLMARIRSSSYMPNAGEALEKARADARAVFDEHETRGGVSLEYVTELHLGALLGQGGRQPVSFV